MGISGTVAGSGQDLDVLPAYMLYNLRGELLLASAKDEAIAADGRYDDFPSLVAFEKLQHCVFVQVRSRQLSFKNRIHAQQHLGDTNLIGNGL